MLIDRQKYFNQLIASTDFEELADKFEKETSIEVSSLAENIEKGNCWYPVYLYSVTSWRKEQQILRFHRTDLDDKKHNLNINSWVKIFNTNIYDQRNFELPGKIRRVGPWWIEITVDINDEELVKERKWLDNRDLAIEIIYKRWGYQKMKNVLEKISEKPDKTETKISNILLGNSHPTQASRKINKDAYASIIKKLNSSQAAAVDNIIMTQDVSLILGPPGTGKTTTIVHAISAIVALGLGNQKILVTAPSNTAVDVLARRLHATGKINVLRLGNSEKIHEEAAQLTLTEKITQHPDFPLLDQLSKAIHRRYQKMRTKKAAKAKNRADSELRNAISEQITKQIYQDAQVIACTLESTVSKDLTTHYKQKFKYVFVDEAGQAIEPTTWLPISRAKRLVLIGDHHQLPPVVKSVETTDFDLKKSLFEKAMDHANIEHNLLAVQYRMHEQIMNFSNNYFYENKLKAGKKNRFHTLAGPTCKEEWNFPFEFLDTCHCDFKENQLVQISSSSTQNIAEAEFLVWHLEQLIDKLNRQLTGAKNTALTIGIITPYRQQLYQLQEQVANSESIQDFAGTVTTNTVDGFQGQEQDIIYISLVRSNTKKQIGFLREYRRMNVAITRAKKKVVLIGDSATLARDPFYKSLIKYAKDKKAYFDIQSKHSRYFEERSIPLL